MDLTPPGFEEAKRRRQLTILATDGDVAEPRKRTAPQLAQMEVAKNDARASDEDSTDEADE